MIYRKKLLLILLAIYSIPWVCYSQTKKDKLDIADSLVERLQPSKFDSLPKNIIQYLEKNGYTIPQCCGRSDLHNVISGPFKKTKQIDWAVLASKNRISRILVFWNGSTKNPSAIAEDKDRIYLQSGVKNIMFSRFIESIGKNSILQSYKVFGESKPPPLEHLGIVDIYDGKGSTIYYYYMNRWIKLTGSD